MLNTSISQFYIQMAQETDTYDWTNKYSPCFFDREENLFLNMIVPHLNESDNPSFAEKCFKSLFLSYSCKCRYVTFFFAFYSCFLALLFVEITDFDLLSLLISFYLLKRMFIFITFS